MNLQSKYSRDEFLSFISSFIPNFGKDIRKVDTRGLKTTTEAVYLGESPDLDLAVFELTHTSSSDARVTLATEGFKLMKDSANFRALIAYIPEKSNDWRLSLMTATPDTTEKGKVILKLSNPRRYSFFLGESAKVNTPYQFLIKQDGVADFDELQKRFSLEVVNKDFYKEISRAFLQLVNGQLKLPLVTDKSQTHLEFAVRLIGRIIFCWFLREKKSETGLPLMPQQILSLDAVKQEEDYYHSILEPVFFEMLNKPIKSRRDDYAKEPFSSVPYLNGGLFSPQEDDYYKRTNGDQQSQFHNTLVLPNKWFIDFFETLETYNFTIDENTSFDEELSIDPEMLGRIFENLLAEINPETGESARKATGSYYTPRTIVNYMVDESLLLYLKQKTNIDEDKLRAIISYDLTDDSEHTITQVEKEKIIDALESLKLLDPACGSGAFPIGALQKIVFVLQQIDSDGQLWFRKQLLSTSPELRRVIEREFEHQNFDYIRKVGIIRENIYGIDIQPIATEISRLRCFLTLIVDERVQDDLDNRGIEPLPNLDFKFVTANSLIGLPSSSAVNQMGLFEDDAGIKELKELRDMFFAATGVEREQLKLQFVQAQNKMFQRMIEGGTKGYADLTTRLSGWDPFSHKASAWFDSEWMFGIRNGFDVVIANPPYVFTRKMDFTDEFKKYVKEYYTSRIKSTHIKSKSKQSGKINLFGLFIIKAIVLLNDDGNMVYIVPNTLLRTTTYDLIRKFILDNTQINRILDLGGGVFEGVTASTIIIQLKKGENASNKVEIISKIDDLMNEKFSKSTIEQKKYVRNISYSFTTHSDNNVEALLDKIEGNHHKLGDYCIDIIEGIVAHKHLIIDAPKEGFEPLIEGKDISKFIVKLPRNWIDWKSNEIHRKRPDYLWATLPKILIQRISGGSNPIVAALDETKYKTFASVNNLVLKEAYEKSYLYVLGILNSRLINYYYANKFSNNSTLTVNISKTFLEALPLDINHNESENKISQIVTKIINQAKVSSKSNLLDNMYKELNLIIYKMYGLTEEEMKAVEEENHE